MPTGALKDQVTDVLVVPLTVAEKPCVCEAVNETGPGPIVTETTGVAFSVTVACAVFVVSATEVALTVTVWLEEMLEGAVYNPDEEIVPTAGLSDQVTDVLVVPLTDAPNVCVCEALNVAEPGVTLTLTLVVAAVPENNVTDACAYLVGSATEVAFTVINCDEGIDDGAVYSPVLEMVPTVGLTDHVTAVLVVYATWAANCWDCDCPNTTCPGLT